jgi:pectate lyase
MRNSHVRFGSFLFAVLATLGSGRAQALVGDCNGDDCVAVNELITGVNIALDHSPLSSCPSFDADGSGRIEINELVKGVNNLLEIQCAPYEGFGDNFGGLGKPVVEVSNCTDGGAALRAAVATSNRYVKLTCEGEIALTARITINGHDITLSGEEAPGAGVTFTGRGLRIEGPAHNIVVKHVRFRDNPNGDAIQIRGGATKVVIDHVSISGAADGNLDISEAGTSDVTVSWSILASPASSPQKNALWGGLATRITAHHNLLADSTQRNPEASYSSFIVGSPTATDPDTSLDFVDNLVWGWNTGYGTKVRKGTRANVTNNYFNAAGSANSRSLLVCHNDPNDGCMPDDGTPASTHTYACATGNRNPNLTSSYWTSKNVPPPGGCPLSAPPVATEDATAAACKVKAMAGARPQNRDTFDADLVAGITGLGACN